MSYNIAFLQKNYYAFIFIPKLFIIFKNYLGFYKAEPLST